MQKFLVVILLIALTLVAEEQPKPKKQSFRPPKEKPVLHKNGDISLGKITLHKKRGEIRFPARVLVRDGVIEFLISTYRGALHESLLVADISPYQLQIMLYLLGADDKKPAKMKGKKGSMINIDLEWKEKGKVKKIPVESLVKDQRTDFVMARKGFYFVGTSFIDNVPQAEGSGNVACLYTRPDAVLDVADEQSYMDTIFVGNTAVHKPVSNQKVTVILSLRNE